GGVANSSLSSKVKRHSPSRLIQFSRRNCGRGYSIPPTGSLGHSARSSATAGFRLRRGSIAFFVRFALARVFATATFGLAASHFTSVVVRLRFFTRAIDFPRRITPTQPPLMILPKLSPSRGQFLFQSLVS